MNYKPGDKVWVKFPNIAEVPDEIVPYTLVPADYVSWCEDHPGHYFVSLKNYCGACTVMLRPRFDDGNEKTNWSKCAWSPKEVTVCA